MSGPPGPTAGGVDEAALRHELLERLAHFRLSPQAILDLGGGLRTSADDLCQRFPGARLFVATLGNREPDAPLQDAPPQGAPATPPWWRRAVASIGGSIRSGSIRSGDTRSGGRVRPVTGTFAHLPLPDGSVQVVLAHLLVPGASALETLLPEVRRVLVPGGLFLWTTLGPGTRIAGPEALGTHDADADPLLLDMHDLGGALARAGFIEPVLDVDRLGGPLPTAVLEVIHLAAFASDRPVDKSPAAPNEEFVIAADAIGWRRRTQQ